MAKCTKKKNKIALLNVCLYVDTLLFVSLFVCFVISFAAGDDINEYKSDGRVKLNQQLYKIK